MRRSRSTHAPRPLHRGGVRLLEDASRLCDPGWCADEGHLPHPRTARGTRRRSPCRPAEPPGASAARRPAPPRRRGRIGRLADRLGVGRAGAREREAHGARVRFAAPRRARRRVGDRYPRPGLRRRAGGLRAGLCAVRRASRRGEVGGGRGGARCSAARVRPGARPLPRACAGGRRARGRRPRGGDEARRRAPRRAVGARRRGPVARPPERADPGAGAHRGGRAARRARARAADAGPLPQRPAGGRARALPRRPAAARRRARDRARRGAARPRAGDPAARRRTRARRGGGQGRAGRGAASQAAAVRPGSGGRGGSRRGGRRGRSDPRESPQRGGRADSRRRDRRRRRRPPAAPRLDPARLAAGSDRVRRRLGLGRVPRLALGRSHLAGVAAGRCVDHARGARAEPRRRRPVGVGSRLGTDRPVPDARPDRPDVRQRLARAPPAGRRARRHRLPHGPRHDAARRAAHRAADADRRPQRTYARAA